MGQGSIGLRSQNSRDCDRSITELNSETLSQNQINLKWKENTAALSTKQSSQRNGGFFFMLRKAVENVTPGECVCLRLFVSFLLKDVTLPTVLL